jgi:hypothetical protein
MRKPVVRGVLAAVLLVSLIAVFMIVSAPESTAGGGNRCEQACYQDYQQCVPYCSKNPCFVSCETVLEICLSNCGSES